ncbi:hypothetical protein Dimus_036920 [Dionaea muscipula]
MAGSSSPRAWASSGSRRVMGARRAAASLANNSSLGEQRHHPQAAGGGEQRQQPWASEGGEQRFSITRASPCEQRRGFMLSPGQVPSCGHAASEQQSLHQGACKLEVADGRAVVDWQAATSSHGQLGPCAGSEQQEGRRAAARRAASSGIQLGGQRLPSSRAPSPSASCSRVVWMAGSSSPRAWASSGSRRVMGARRAAASLANNSSLGKQRHHPQAAGGGEQRQQPWASEGGEQRFSITRASPCEQRGGFMLSPGQPACSEQLNGCSPKWAYGQVPSCGHAAYEQQSLHQGACKLEVADGRAVVDWQAATLSHGQLGPCAGRCGHARAAPCAGTSVSPVNLDLVWA